MSLGLHDIRFAYQGRPLLDGIRIEVPAGRIGFLLGPSGSGKTTLLRIAAGLQTPTAGAVRVDSRDVGALPTHRRRIGLVPQDQALFPHLDVGGNVAFGLRYQGLDRRARHDAALQWLSMVGLADRIADPVDALSGGERQRVALVRTLATRPRVVLLDEPLSGLDQALRAEVGQRTRDLLVEGGVAALWVTHDEGEATRWGDHVWRLQQGKAVPQDLAQPGRTLEK